MKPCQATWYGWEGSLCAVYFSYHFLFEMVLTVFERTEVLHLPRFSTRLWFSKWCIFQSHTVMEVIHLMSFDLFVSSVHL